jgi:hypothetical protein
MIAHVVAEASRTKSRMPIGDDGEDYDPAMRKLRAEADLAEMRVEREAGTLVRLSDIQPNLDRLADALRNLGENFRRSPMPISGNDIGDLINQTIENVEWELS